jgi:hypothetical protein
MATQLALFEKPPGSILWRAKGTKKSRAVKALDFISGAEWRLLQIVAATHPFDATLSVYYALLPGVEGVALATDFHP